MKIIVAGALRVITTQGKTNMTISRCIFEDIAMEARQGTFVQIPAGNCNAGMVVISDSLIVSNIKKKGSPFDKFQTPHQDGERHAIVI